MPPPQEQHTNVGRLMDEIEGEDLRRIARIVDAKVDELRDELKGDIGDLGDSIKYSLGELAGKIAAAQTERSEAARTAKEIASKLDQHIGEHAATEAPGKRPWWQDPRWLSAAATLGMTVLALLLALGQETARRVIDFIIAA